MLKFSTEDWGRAEVEIRNLTPAHWDMLALNKPEIPLDIRWELYRQNAANGSLHLLTARLPDESLAGYYVSIVAPHPHYAGTLFGMVDAYFIAPPCRTPQVGIQFFDALEEAMRALGVKCLITTTKLHYDISPVLERCGWQPAGKTYTLYLGD